MRNDNDESFFFCTSDLFWLSGCVFTRVIWEHDSMMDAVM